MFVIDNFGFAKRKSIMNNPLKVEATGVVIGEKKIELDNPGHLVRLFVQATYNDLGPIMALNNLLDLANKKFDGFSVLEKFTLFERQHTPSMQAVAFESLLSKIRPADFTTEKVNNNWEFVLEALGFKKPKAASLVAPKTFKMEEITEVTTVELKGSVTVAPLTEQANINEPIATQAEGEVQSHLKQALDNMDDLTFEALKGLMIDDLLVGQKLDPSKAAVAREILMASVTMDILHSDNPEEAILALLNEKVINKESFDGLVAQATQESEKLPNNLGEAVENINGASRQFPQPKRRKGNR